MILTAGQQKALRALMSGENTLLLGSAGTGKTTVLEEFIKFAEKQGKKIAVTASTGIAAQLIEGWTIHRFLHYTPGTDIHNANYTQKAENLWYADVLIIDEISMIGRRLMEYIGRCIAQVTRPVQLVLVGDFYQLPPVQDRYAFTSPWWFGLNLTPCVLTEVVRQSDAEFIHNLDLLKYGDSSCLDFFRTHASSIPIKDQITVCATRHSAQEINEIEINRLSGPSQVFPAEYEGEVCISDLIIEDILLVKKGMRIMSVVNGNGFSNGSLGTVTGFGEAAIEVLFDNGYKHTFKREHFSAAYKGLSYSDADVKQFPLIPAYAITIHKSQGQTFGSINIDGGGCWAPGQLYVAISRARSIEGIHFLSPIRKWNVKTDPSVRSFYDNLKAG